MGNSLKQSKGVITRKRVTKNNIEESTIDFVLISEDRLDEVDTVIVLDDERSHVLTKSIRNKDGIKKVESDCNPIISKFKLYINMKPEKRYST